MLEREFVSIETDGSGNVLKQTSRRIKYFDDEAGYLFRLNKEAIKTFKGCGLPSDLGEVETARVYRLSLVTHKGSNLICYRSGNVIKAMDNERIAKYLEVSERQASRFVNRMIEKRIIGKVRVRIGHRTETQYYVNPIYFFNGKWLSYNLYFLFKRDLDGILPEWVKERFNQDFGKNPRVQT